MTRKRNDPLYVRWQYGLGRAAVFTSDAKSRWAADWIHWPGFDKFWINVTRDLLPHSDRIGSHQRISIAANQDLVVNYHLAAGQAEPEQVPEIFVMGPDGFQKPIEVVRTAAGHLSKDVCISANCAACSAFVRWPILRAFPEVGFYRQQEEMLDYGSNAALLRQIATLTGGDFNPAAQEVFRNGGRSLPTTWRLWPGLLAAAIVLTIVELLVRKWRGIFQSFSAR